jgi:iron(III) transport system substrate-binding protein
MAMRHVVYIFLILVCVAGCGKKTEREVVIYTSVDQVFSEPILKDYEKEQGIKVNAVYDVEASKTTGLVNRLIAEKDKPKCDVFWNSEFSRTIVLKEKGVLAPYVSPSAGDIPEKFKDAAGYWTGFAARARVLIYNTNMMKKADLPRSIFQLADPKWKGNFALAYPLFGTTATHVAALYAALGKEMTEKYLQALQANDVLIVDGNSVVRDLVVDGQVPVGFTDTDDVNVAVQAGKPVKMFFPDKEGFGTLLIPNTVALIKNAPHPEEGKRLVDYLLSKEVESKLAFSEAAQIPVRDDVPKPKGMPGYSSINSMKVDYDQVAQKLDEATRFCQKLFIR